MRRRRRLLDGLTEARGGATMETGLILALGAMFALTVREFVASPFLAQFTRAVRIISQALA